MATLAPSAARRFAIAAPITREPPVTNATFFANLDMCLLCHLRNNSESRFGCDLARSCRAVMNHSVLYDDEDLAEDAEILNYVVLYRIMCLWGARRTLVESKCWRRRCPSSGSMGSRTLVFRNWNEPQA